MSEIERIREEIGVAKYEIGLFREEHLSKTQELFQV